MVETMSCSLEEVFIDGGSAGAILVSKATVKEVGVPTERKGEENLEDALGGCFVLDVAKAVEGERSVFHDDARSEADTVVLVFQVLWGERGVVRVFAEVVLADVGCFSFVFVRFEGSVVGYWTCDGIDGETVVEVLKLSVLAKFQPNEIVVDGPMLLEKVFEINVLKQVATEERGG